MLIATSNIWDKVTSMCLFQLESRICLINDAYKHFRSFSSKVVIWYIYIYREREFVYGLMFHDVWG
jgi:hypothetical protein